MRTIMPCVRILAAMLFSVCVYHHQARALAQSKAHHSSQQSLNGVRAELFEEVEAALEIAQEEEAAILAPKAFEQGLLNYQQAEQKFQQGGKLDEIRRHLKLATQAFQQALAGVNWAKQAFPLMLTARDDARHAQAPTYTPQLWLQAEAKMRKCARTLEEGNLKGALKLAVTLEKQYRQAELEAIRKQPRPDWRNLSASLDEQRDSIDKLQQELQSSHERVSSLQEKMTVLERKVSHNPTADPVRPPAPTQVKVDQSLQSYFSPQDAVVLREDGALIIRLFALDFFPNGASLSSSGADLLWRAGGILKRLGQGSVTVTGHVYSGRDQAENLKLARERAESVKSYLIENVLLSQPVVAIGYGDTAPLPKNELINGRGRNERVDIVLEFGPHQVSYLYRSR